MEKIIKQLVELAEEYKVEGKKARLKQSHNSIGGGVSVYFADKYHTCSVTFSVDALQEVEIMLYASKVQMPFNTTAAELQQVLDNATVYLEEWKAKNDQERKKRKDAAKAALAKELAELEAEVERKREELAKL